VNDVQLEKAVDISRRRPVFSDIIMKYKDTKLTADGRGNGAILR
jgi:hypothetical protein